MLQYLASVPLNYLPMDAIGAGQDTLAYKIILSIKFFSRVNLKPAFVVTDLQMPGHQQNCYGFWGLRLQTPLNFNSFTESSTSDS